MEFFDTFDRLSHACGVSCRVRVGDTRPVAAPDGTEGAIDLTPRPRMRPRKGGSPVPASWKRLNPGSAAGLGMLRGMSRLGGTPEDHNLPACRLSHLNNIRAASLVFRK